MTDLITILKSFNRKERFFLIGQALGNSHFILADSFKKKLSDKLELNIPSNAFVAMDYHIDWIFASLFLFLNPKKHPPYKTDGALTATQEDVDLIIAFIDRDIYHLILIEAKGETSWSNKQLNSKSERLKKIFGTQKFDGKLIKS